MRDEQEVYDHATTAAHLGVSTRTLTHWRERGLIAAEVRYEGLNPRYYYTATAIAECQQRVGEMRAQQA
jgi:DNA-binding transcriptional MerR regulator